LQDAANAGYSPVAAPVAPPAPTVNQPAPPTTTIDLSKIGSQPDLTVDVNERNNIWGNIEKTITKDNWNSQANDAFLDAAMRYKFGKRNINGQNRLWDDRR